MGRYRIEKTLGKGAMGVVYLGQDTKLNRLVAIKTLPLSQEFEAEELQEATIRFFREAEAAGRLTHSSIISIYEAGEEQDLAYISMEFFKGGNLVAYTVPNNLLPIFQVIDIIEQAAKALDYAHRQGVVHRDIKPANIMYNQVTRQIKMTDFGIAYITDSNKTRTGIILGTPSYMSPEQLAGKPVDGRTDLFSLGVMLYKLLTGVLPFQADSLTTLMFKITNESPLDITTVRADVPLCLKRVVEVALQKEVNKRYQSGAEFACALHDCQTNGEI
ncbi:Serine/threonine protein kinase [Beggiatoa sp. PS]|nr:Serine/threonine protein kinase [Beggiatoa sp. PS]